MHESIATAIYRGFARGLDGFEFDIKRYPRPKTRAAFLRTIDRMERNDKTCVLLQEPELFGEGKRASRFSVSASMADLPRADGTTQPVWVGVCFQADAKTFSTNLSPLPVMAAQHTVIRAMQRMSLTDPREAIRRMAPAFLMGAFLDAPNGREALFAVDGGAVAAAGDSEYPDLWVLKTFIHLDQLRPEQVREASIWTDRATACIAQHRSEP